jgi:hypothetical protein
MTKIGPTPPDQRHFEPEKHHEKARQPSHHQAEVSSAKHTHKRKLNRFAKVHGSAQVQLNVTYGINSPIRHQWNENSGYCGETCLIAASLMNGAYYSQFDVRDLAAEDPFPGVDPKKPQSTCQVLLGDNDQYTAAHMGLTTETPSAKDSQNGTAMIAWIRKELSEGRPAIIGVYENQSVFGQDDPDVHYDHIVTITQISDTTITLHDNGLYDGPPKDTITIPLKSFLQTRSSANSPDAPVYSLCSGGPCFGIAITGNNRDSLPVTLAASPNGEPNEIVDGSNTRPPPSPVHLTATVNDLQVGKQYTLYENGKAVKTFTAHTTSYTYSTTIESDQTTIFRCVAS